GHLFLYHWRLAGLPRLDEQAMFWPRYPKAEFLKALHVQVKRFAGMGECLRERVAACDDFRKIGEVDREDRLGCLISDSEDITSIVVHSWLHSPSTSRSLRMSSGWHVLRRPCGRT